MKAKAGTLEDPVFACKKPPKNKATVCLDFVKLYFFVLNFELFLFIFLSEVKYG